eukprot:984747-Pyramimonas_sp.AAC.1
MIMRRYTPRSLLDPAWDGCAQSSCLALPWHKSVGQRIIAPPGPSHILLWNASAQSLQPSGRR